MNSFLALETLLFPVRGFDFTLPNRSVLTLAKRILILLSNISCYLGIALASKHLLNHLMKIDLVHLNTFALYLPTLETLFAVES